LTTEESLIESLKRHERGAQRLFYDRSVRYATAVAMRYVADNEAVRDILQDCYVKIFMQFDRFEYRGEKSLKRWVCRIVSNECITYLRTAGRLNFTHDMPDVAEDAETDIDRVPRDVLYGMIRKLPTGYRTVLNLYVFDQMDHKQIGEKLGISRYTSASQYLRAKNLLSKMIKKYKQQHETE